MNENGLQDYVKDVDLEGLCLFMTESLLRDRPTGNIKRYLLEKLKNEERKSKGEEDIDGIGDLGQWMQHEEQNLIPGDSLLRLFESTRNITAEIVPKETIHIIINESIKLMNCDRVSLFVYDKKLNVLFLSASNLSKPIRVAPGQGIAGHVFLSQESVNIPDCYKDKRFDPSFDKLTGYYTKSMLVMPIVDFCDESVGVLQAINKIPTETGEFTQVDELMMGHLTQHAGIALRNSEVYKDAILATERANGLLNMVQSLTQDLGTQSTILTITMHANDLVQADRCTVFLVDEAAAQLWSVSTDSGKEIRIPRKAGIAGEACENKQIINIPDAYADKRFNQAIDKRTGYHTQSILAIPVVDDHMRSLAVIQMINKKDYDDAIGTFLEDDVRTMETFAKFVANKLVTTTFLSQGQKARRSEAAQAFGSSLDDQPEETTKRKSGITPMGGIVEGGRKTKPTESARRQSKQAMDMIILEDELVGDFEEDDYIV